jgi:ABC-type sugar transport system substrate-binding protein
MKKLMIALLVTLLCVSAFSACGVLPGIGEAGEGAESSNTGVSEEQQDWGKTVVVILPSEEHESAEEYAAAAAKFEDSGWNTVLRVCGDDEGQYEEAFAEAVRNRAAGIICDNMRADDVTEAVRSASEAEIPVILLDRGITERGLCLAQITTDMEKNIAELALRFIDRLGGNARYMSVVQDDDDRSSDMISAFQVGMIDHTGMYEVMNRSINGYDMSDAESEIREVFLVNPSIEAVVCANSRVTDAMLYAMETMGRTDIVVVCVEGDLDGIASWVEEGRIFGTITRPASNLGEKGADTMLAFLKNGTVPQNEWITMASGLKIQEAG